MGSQGLQQVQKQTQSLILAPQLRQSLKILQVPTLELRNTIIEELQINPTLEEFSSDGMSIEEQLSNPNESSETEERTEMEFSDEDFSKLSNLDEDWNDYFSQDMPSQSYSSEDAERRNHFFDSLVTGTSLQEHLLRQAELLSMTEKEMEAMHFLIGSIDDKGFLTSDVANIAEMADLPLQAVQNASETLKTFDPPGIGCRDLNDSLIHQLKMSGRENSLAVSIIKDHYKLLLRKRIPEIARKTGCSINEVQDAIEEISELDPAPGRKFNEDNNRIIVPDVKVEKDGENWVIILNNDYIPRLRISNTYKQLIAKGKLSSKEKEYIRDKMRSGKFLISSIEQRQQTIERVTQQILKFQEDFFENGISHLRPLTMSQVAKEISVHETTVSRAIANKYIDTPYGVFEFKYFFTPGYQAQNGEAVSNTSIKELISQIIDSESPSKPFSDQAIVKILAEKDVKIARRTVAKYREELGILPTNLRRDYR